MGGHFRGIPPQQRIPLRLPSDLLQRVLPSWHPPPRGTPPDAPRCPLDDPSSPGVLPPVPDHIRRPDAILGSPLGLLEGPSAGGPPGPWRPDPPRAHRQTLSLRVGSSRFPKENGPASIGVDRGLWTPLLKQESRDESYPIWGRVAPLSCCCRAFGPDSRCPCADSLSRRRAARRRRDRRGGRAADPHRALLQAARAQRRQPAEEAPEQDLGGPGARHLVGLRREGDGRPDPAVPVQVVGDDTPGHGAPRSPADAHRLPAGGPGCAVPVLPGAPLAGDAAGGGCARDIVGHAGRPPRPRGVPGHDPQQDLGPASPPEHGADAARGRPSRDLGERGGDRRPGQGLRGPLRGGDRDRRPPDNVREEDVGARGSCAT